MGTFHKIIFIWLYDSFFLTIVSVSDLGVLVLAGVEVGHERRDVLRGREPGVDVLARVDRKSTRLNSSHPTTSRMPSSA